MSKQAFKSLYETLLTFVGLDPGKPRGTIQSSMYDKDKEMIFHLYKLGVPIREIINKHLRYGKYLSLLNYVKKRYNED